MPLSTGALTTLEKLKSILGIASTFTDYDTQLEAEINKISAMVESMTGRQFGLKTYKEWVAGSDIEILQLKGKPIVEVAVVQNMNEDITDYEILDAREPSQLFRPFGYWPLINRNASPTRLGLGRSAKTYYVEYDAGYVLPKDATEETPSTLPQELEDLVLTLANKAWKKYQNTGGNSDLIRYKDSQLEYWFSDSSSSEFQYKTLMDETDMSVIKLYKSYYISN